MKRFLKHFLILLFVVPLVLILLFITRCAATYEVVDQYGILTKSTVTEADGTVYCEVYQYTHAFTAVTIKSYENDTLVATETRELTEQDPLLRDTFEVLPHPTATAATTDREEDASGSNVILRYYDAEGNAEGYSKLFYNRWDRLARQEDFNAEGNLLRTTNRQFAGHTISVSNLSGTEPTE